MGVGVKRRMPLMLHEHSPKKSRGKKIGRQNIDSGPTIHELDPDTDLFPEQLLDEASSSIEEIPLVSFSNHRNYLTRIIKRFYTRSTFSSKY